MKDEWSLKDKCKIIMEKRTYGDFDGFELLEASDGDVYKTEDIETLRKKLIEDISIHDSFDNILVYEYQKYVIKCINKRFGVYKNGR